LIKSFFTKFSEQLKKELHEYIDSIEDEKTLMMVHEDLVEYLKKGKVGK
jgi:phage shock protein A